MYFALLLFYFYGKKQGLKVFLVAVFTFFVTFFLTDLTKMLVGRLRPNNVEDLVVHLRILQHPETFSFFSGHASSSFAIATFMVLALRSFNKWIYLAYLWPLLFAFSRIYVGVHYPSDILIGSLVGTSVALMMFMLYKRYIKRSPANL